MNRSEKLTLPRSFPSGGMSTSSTREATILPKAAPMMTPTARSRTFPRMANSLNTVVHLKENLFCGTRPDGALGGKGRQWIGSIAERVSALPENQQRAEEA